MALTHTHNVVVKGFDDTELISNHLDSEGNEFGHDEHKSFLSNRKNSRSMEHTHNGVEERYSEISDSIAIHPEDKEAKKESAVPVGSTTSQATVTK